MVFSQRDRCGEWKNKEAGHKKGAEAHNDFPRLLIGYRTDDFDARIAERYISKNNVAEE